MGKVAFITGASGGVGSCYAKKLASKGWQLILSGRNIEKLRQVACQIKETSAVKIELMPADLNKEEDVSRLTHLLEQRDDIYMFVAAAGFAVPTPFDTGNLQKQEAMINVHISANIRLTHALLKQMNKRNAGTLVFVNSTMAFFEAPGNAIYCASKDFMNVFAKCLSRELIYTKIKVQAFNPGMMRTGFHHTEDFKAIESEGMGPDFAFMNPEEAVEYSYKKLKSKKVMVIPGHGNRMAVRMRHMMNFIFMKIIMGDNMGRAVKNN